jgi:Concanavalin A-like lectin/glucanases superfamily/Secretion system C-terminal sorting domain
MKKLLLLGSTLLLSLCIMAQTPVAYYPFNGNANDAVGSLNGTVNGATLTTDRFGHANSAYSFNGTVNNINLTNSNIIRPVTAITISAWVFLQHPNVGILGNSVISCSDDAGYNITFFEPNQIEFSVRRNNADASVTTDASAYYNAWHFVVGTYDGRLAKIYIDGVLKGTNDAGAVFPIQYSATANTYIGVEPGPLFSIDPNFNYLGAIDEVKIYNVALTAAQVQNEYLSNNNYGSQFGNSVKMNGVNDQIELGSTYNQQIFTVEMWVKPGATQVQYANIIDNNHTGTTNWVCQQNASNTNLYGFGVNTNGVTAGIEFQLQANVWQHIALIRDATVVQVYVNGVLVQSNNISGTNIFSGQFLRLGNWGGGGRNWNGTMDEVRFWNTARTQAQIVANMSSQLTGTEAGLVGYWDMNRNGQGAGLTVDNKATATGAALNGTTVGTASTPIFELGITQQKPGSGNAISFDGVDDGVEVTNSAALQFPGDLSVECWVKIPAAQNNTANPQNAILEKWGGNNAGIGYPFVFRLNRSIHSVAFLRYDGATAKGVDGIIIVDDNKWHHLVATKSGSILSFYIDGILQGTDTDFANLSNVNNAQNLNIGTRGPIAVDPNNLTGQIDEVRIWNVGMTQSQIRDRICHKITSSDALYPNLVAYYNFDESTGTTAFDGTVNANNGTLANSPTRITSGAAIGNASSHDYVNATKTTSLTHPTGESFTVTSSSGNPDGVQIYRVDEQPNTLSGATGVGSNNKYFGVFQVGGTTPQYTALYNYNGNTLVNATNENTLALFKRNDNAAATWANSSAALNTTAKTLTITGQSTEYILGSTGAALPLNLIFFTGSKQNNNALLQWQTANEINTAFFEIQRSTDGRQFITARKINAGSSNYTFEDANAFAAQQKLFYRLKTVDKDGRFTYCGIVLLQANAGADVSIFPNPVTAAITVANLKQGAVVRILNSNGSIVKQQLVTAQSITIDMMALSAGMYLLQYQNTKTGATETVKIIKQ